MLPMPVFDRMRPLFSPVPAQRSVMVILVMPFVAKIWPESSPAPPCRSPVMVSVPILPAAEILPELSPPPPKRFATACFL